MSSKCENAADCESTPLPCPPNNTHTAKQFRIVAIVSGLLLAEFFCQSIYYEHIRRQDRKAGLMGWFESAAVVVPKSDEYIANLELETCKFPVYYDKSRFNFKLKDNLFVEPGNWRERNKKYVGNEDAQIVYYNIKRNEETRQRIYAKNPSLPPVQRNLTFVHIGKYIVVDFT